MNVIPNIFSNKVERVRFEIKSLGHLDAATINGVESLSALFEYEIESIVDAGRLMAARPAGLIGQTAELALRDTVGGQRTIHGIVAEADLTPTDQGGGRLRVILRPPFSRLKLGSDCRVFQDLDAVAIAEAVLTTAGIPFRNETTGKYATRVYTAQYRESDFAFVSRLLEDEGVYYWFDHAEGSILVLADRSPASPELDLETFMLLGRGPSNVIRFHEGTGFEAPGEQVLEFGARTKLMPNKYTLASFDFLKPAFKVGGQTGQGPMEVYDAPGAATEDPKVLKGRAERRGEYARAREARNFGRTGCVRFAPGRHFELVGHLAGRYDGKHIITQVEISAEGIGYNRGEGSKPISVTFTALPLDLPYRPPMVTPAPKHSGLQSGLVVGPGGEDVHPDETGRIRLQQHWDRLGPKTEAAGRWVRAAQRGTGGSMLLPRVGWNVFSFGEEGSTDVPVVMSRTFDAEHPPPYALPENKTRVAFKTATTPADGTTNELRYEDKKGSEEMFLNSTRDFNVLVKDQKAEIVHRDMTRKVGIDHVLEVGATLDQHIVGTQTVVVKGNQIENVAADRTKVVEGSESIKIGAKRTLTTGANAEFSGQSRGVKVGAAMIDAVLGGVAQQSKMVNTLVGGAVVKVTPRKITEAVGSTVNADTAIGLLPSGVKGAVDKLKKVPGASKLLEKIPSKAVGASIQTVGVAKFELGAERKIKASLTYTEKVLGAMNLITTALQETTTEAWKLTAKLLEGKAPKITIESDKEVTLKVGPATLTVGENGIKLTAPEIQIDKATLIKAKAAKIEQN